MHRVGRVRAILDGMVLKAVPVHTSIRHAERAQSSAHTRGPPLSSVAGSDRTLAAQATSLVLISKL